MTQRYLALGKIMLLLLALGTPIFLYQAYRNQRALQERDAALKASFSEERLLVVHRIAQRFFGDPALLREAVLRRRLPAGPIEGLPPPPDVGTLSGIGIRADGPSDCNPRFCALLFEDESFPSGLPKRFTGLVALINGGGAVLSESEMDRFSKVWQEFWYGTGLDDESYAFLLHKLPAKVAGHFSAQRRFLSAAPVMEKNPFHALVTVGDQRYLLAPDGRKLKELNRILHALDQDATFVLSDAWTDWKDLRTTLRLTPGPGMQQVRKTRNLYLGAGGGVALVLLMLYGVIAKYDKVNRVQKQLLAATSHELRTPLAVIRQFSEMLLDRGDRFQPKHRTYHQYIHRECLKMQYLVENLLSAAKIEFLSFSPSAQAIELNTWLDVVVASFARLDHRKQIQVDAPAIEVWWDPSMMEQVLFNLLDNAVNHAETDVALDAFRAGDRVTLSIRDFGMAPDLSRLKRIEAFRPGAGKGTGLGLGIYLADRIVKAHGGRMSFEHADPGLRVVLDLPLRGGAVPEKRQRGER